MKTYLTFLICLSTVLAQSQNIEFQGTVKFKTTPKVYKIVTVDNCTYTHAKPTGSPTTTVTYTTTYKNGKTDIVIKDEVTSTTSTTAIPITKSFNKEVRPSYGDKANLYIDEKDKTKIYVNYWLSGSNIVANGCKVEEFQPAYDCDGKHIGFTPKLSTAETISGNKEYVLYKVPPLNADMNTTWFLHSDHFEVKDASGTLLYYLVDRYGRNTKYILELNNRESLPYTAKSLDFSALTIPFKYRFGFTKNSIKIHDDVTASFNVGVYLGYKLTNYSIINKGGMYINRTRWSLRSGPFINLSTTTLDSLSTRVGKVPMAGKETRNIALLSTGLGLMGDLKGFQLGLYGGWDFAVGPYSSNWNYHRRFWMGIGLGYKITDLFAKKE